MIRVGTKIYLPPFEDEPEQWARVIGIQRKSRKDIVYTIELQPWCRDNRNDDGIREVTRDQFVRLDRSSK